MKVMRALEMQVHRASKVRRVKDRKISSNQMVQVKVLRLKNNLAKRLQNLRKLLQRRIKMNRKKKRAAIKSRKYMISLIRS